MTHAIISDLHCYNWSAFSTTLPTGINSRLQHILDEVKRCARVLDEMGGYHILIAGDVFHVRGNIDPEVLNAFQRTIVELLEKGIRFDAIPGNHDLKSKDTNWLASAIENLAQLGGDMFRVHNTPTVIDVDNQPVAMVPWRNTTKELLADLQQLTVDFPEPDKLDVLIHAGIEGVLAHSAGSELNDEALGKFGFKGVFAGHYHNHKVMRHGVVSIGATTHHTWSDVGTRAGFLTVDDNHEVKFHDTHAPKFIDVSGMDEMEMRLEVPGNYARFRGPAMSATDQNELRAFLVGAGALGVLLDVPKIATSARGTVPIAAGRSLDESVMAFVDARTDLPAHIDRAALKRRAAEVLEKSRELVE